MATPSTNDYTSSAQSAAKGFANITPADSNLATSIRALYVGVAGDVTVRSLADDSTNVIFKNAPAGLIIPGMMSQVRSTGTIGGAADYVGFYE